MLNDPGRAKAARALAEAEDEDSTEAQLRALQTPELRVIQDIFDLLVQPSGVKLSAA